MTQGRGDGDRNQESRDDYLAGQISRLDEELEMLREVMCTQVTNAIEAGIMRAAGNPELWKAASAAIQVQAKQRAGGWLLTGIGALFSKAGWIVMALVAVYTLGGFPAVLAMVKAWATSNSP